ncbi:MAG: helicase, partial [Acidimicrobiia bacterium]
MSATYADFLARKSRVNPDEGRHLDDLPPSLFAHQAEVVRWAGRRGRAAAFLDTGLGKTRIQLAWADAMRDNGAALVICPLSIAKQTSREAAAIGIDAPVVRSGDAVTGPGVWITNYEMQHAFDPAAFGAVVLDESSILKNHEGRTRGALVERWGRVRYRLACTATPAPNDHTELTNHAEFLGAMKRVEMLAAFFVHDDDGWRLKGHASDAMYRWMASWAVAARHRSDVTGNPN